MSLGEHFVELRNRIIISLVAIFAGALVSFIFSEHLITYFTQHAGELVFLSPPEAFITSIKLSVFVGFMAALPIVLSQFWLFILPALTRSERITLYIVIPSSILLFYAGIVFCFYLVLPMAVRFLTEFGSPALAPMFSLRNYVAFMLQLLLPFGLVFEIPLMTSILVRLRLISARALRRSRKYALVIVFVVAAILTPPDITTQLMLALPIILLYEVSILLAWILRPRG